MMKMVDSGRGLVRCLGLAAAAILLLSAAGSQRAEALSPINPAAAPAAKQVSQGLTTEIRGGHGGGGHGGGGGHHGGGGFRGGGFHAGGAVFHGGGGGGYRAAPVFHGGGFRHGGFAVRHHHHFGRHFVYGPSYYAYPSYYYPYRVCRVIRTHYGPRRICHFRHRHHHYRRHHHHRHHHYRYW